jgi:hypothetical protein
MWFEVDGVEGSITPQFPEGSVVEEVKPAAFVYTLLEGDAVKAGVWRATLSATRDHYCCFIHAWILLREPNQQVVAAFNEHQLSRVETPTSTTTTQAPATTLAASTPTVLPATRLPDELLVLSAIAEFLPDGQVCEEQFLSADSPERGWEGWNSAQWETGIDGFEEFVVQITCDFESEEYWFSHTLRIQYPLKTGEAARVINSEVRSAVARGILDYFIDSRDRFSDLRLTEEEQRSDQKQHRGCGAPGYLAINGVVPYSNDGLHSVYLSFGQNHPCANTTGNPVVTLNFDVFGKPDTSGYDRPRMSFGLSDLFKDGSGWEAELVEVILRRWAETDNGPYEGLNEELTDEFVWSLDFTMGPDTLALHAQPYTVWFPGWGGGSSSDHLEIDYEELAEYLHPDGPYRLISNY